MSQVIQEVAKNANLEVISISQKNIGINLRSTPLTYMNVFAQIRQLFAKKNKVSASLFSYNSKGAYPHCHGKGVIISEMSFMDDIVTTCEVCHGSRYKSEVIKYKYHSKTIVDILKMIVQESNVLFADELFAIDLATLSEVGLGYLRLNQSLTTLSGGELQRLKLASQLHKKGAFYVLDKPTDGLHLIDVKYLLNLVNRIVDEGNTVLLVEHNIEVLKQVDWLIEVGPEGGNNGGKLIFQGTPLQLVLSEDTITKPYFEKN